MSGGVDSSVSAHLLKEAGHEVIGAFIKVWQPDFLPCGWREERRDAMRVAAELGIPFVTIDLEAEYKKGVVDYMIGEYRAGRVPNPDVMCNKSVKFGAFLDRALALGADSIATGHYARIGIVDGRDRLLKGKDSEKDQSYFLWTLGERELSRTLFPVGELEKSEVRAIAIERGLPNATKKDSQGLCFMGPVDIEEFLGHYLSLVPGAVLDERGEVVGEHRGATIYAIGQRHGFSIENDAPHRSPHYVVAKDIEKNTITVSSLAPSRSGEGRTRVRLSSDNLPEASTRCEARIRYRGELAPASIEREGVECFVRFDAPMAGISDGQSLVAYDDDVCLGGGIIEPTH